MPSQNLAAHMASIEAISVIFAAVLVWLSALVQHVSNVVLRGTPYVVGDRSMPPAMEGFFGRATRTLANNIESALMYVPPVVVILVLHRTTGASQLSAETYIGARVVYALSYWLKIPFVRSLAWFVGMICCGAVLVLAVVPFT
ncbi:MAG: MAPEG family protein [Caulobacterales bacterium]